MLGRLPIRGGPARYPGEEVIRELEAEGYVLVVVLILEDGFVDGGAAFGEDEEVRGARHNCTMGLGVGGLSKLNLGPLAKIYV